ncbi:helix-turn-helix transcriptional regulator [Paenibacillus thalictri]|uniref:AraC family transcriptional regulator n=1 Tax=Paenibacillus thalictri TaxID=2527873 RepID=A0A4Q9DUP5_9BACL|nr:helix-turn-helix transcriptional regulator [Paenibacillus thalictri]TBL78500.1 AraC family transcriptional regulator [Paenibacillus thalictri]
MDYEFFKGFDPKIVDVVKRDLPFWHSSDFRLYRERTRLHILALVVAGEGTLRLGDNERQVLLPGTVFQVWPGNRMEILTSPEHPLCFYSIHYQYGLLHWSGNKAEWHGAEGPLPCGDYLPGLGTQTMDESFMQLHHIWHHKEVGYDWEARVGILSIIMHLTAAVARRRAVQEAGAAAMIVKAISHIKANYRENLTREMMAKHASHSPAYFSSLFKKHTGFSPIQYLTRIRLDKAKQLLRESQMPIKQVAEEVGFTDSFYFTRLFTQDTGLTPSHYRKA